MPILTGPELMELAQAAGADIILARIMAAAALAESGGNPDAIGDAGASRGLYQIHDIHGLPANLRHDPVWATQWMLDHEFARAYEVGRARGYPSELLARFVCMMAERPWGWTSTDPGVHSPAADRYAAMWQGLVYEALDDLQKPAAIFDPDTPSELQVQDWACSIRTATWLLKSIGIPADAGTLQDQMVAQGLVTPEYGLMDGTGGRLGGFLSQQYGVIAWSTYPATWEQLAADVGECPVAIGGYAWNHWSPVRTWLPGEQLALANPAPGWMGIHDTLTRADWDRLGPWAMVWIELEPPVVEPIGTTPDESPRLTECKRAGDIILAEVEKALAVPRLPKKAREILESGIRPAAETVSRGGLPRE